MLLSQIKDKRFLSLTDVKNCILIAVFIIFRNIFYASGCLTDGPDALCIQAVRPLVRAYDRTYHVPVVEHSPPWHAADF